MSTIYMIRHGQSVANERHVWGGDFPLTPNGRKQASNVTGLLPEVPDIIVASTLLRTRETAEMAFPNRMLVIDPAFDELAAGDLDLEPMTAEDWRMCKEDPITFQLMHHGDDPAERAEKAMTRLRKYSEKYPVTAIFTSKALMQSTFALMAGIPVKEAAMMQIGNCAVYRLAPSTAGTFRIETCAGKGDWRRAA